MRWGMLVSRRPAGLGKDGTVTGEHLVCASCAHRVAEARCPTCRSTLRRLEQSGPSYAVLLSLALALLALSALLAGHLGG
jgi:hypothetical protein